MAKRSARLLTLAALAFAAAACGGRAEAADAWEYRDEFTGQPEDALAQIRAEGEGCETDRFWARPSSRDRWIPWFDTDVEAANALFRDHDGFVPFPPYDAPLVGAETLAWCGGYVAATPGPDPGPEPGPTPVAGPRDPWEGYDLSAARARVAAAPYNDEGHWRTYEFSDGELDTLTYGPHVMPFLPAPFCTIQEGRPPLVGAETFKGWVRDAERAWDEAAGQDVVEYLGDCGPPADDDSANGAWSDERVRLHWGTALENSARDGAPLALIRGVVRFASLSTPGEARLSLGSRAAGSEGRPPPHSLVRISDRAYPREIPRIIVHEMGHALTLDHSGSPGEIMWPYLRAPTPVEYENAVVARISAREAAILRAAIARVRAMPHLGYGMRSPNATPSSTTGSCGASSGPDRARSTTRTSTRTTASAGSGTAARSARPRR